MKWKCTDIEIQRHVVRSIAAFLDSVSAETLQNPLFKVFLFSNYLLIYTYINYGFGAAFVENLLLRVGLVVGVTLQFSKRFL